MLEFPNDINDATTDDLKRLDRFLEFADLAIDWIVGACLDALPDAHHEADLAGSGPDFADNLKRAHAHERVAIMAAREKLADVPRADLMQHRLVGPLLKVKTQLAEAIWNAWYKVKDAAGNAAKATSLAARQIVEGAKQVLAPISTVVNSAFEACGLPPPAEFLESLGHLVDYIHKKWQTTP